MAVLTSGGAARGRSAAIRTVAVAEINRGHTIFGVHRGDQGLLEGDAAPLRLADIEGLPHVGGSILGSSRSAELPTPEGQARARTQLRALGIDALLIIGGN